MKTYIGIDNGVTGAIAILKEDEAFFYQTPVIKTLNYTKTRQFLNRLNIIKFFEIIDNHIDSVENTKVVIERPMVNSTRFKATISAIRCLEATLIGLESRRLGYDYCDSRNWQKELLPSGLKKEELKFASKDIGIRMFPQFKDLIIKQKDADALLIAEYARRKGL
jgi:hypothetical protein